MFSMAVTALAKSLIVVDGFTAPSGGGPGPGALCRPAGRHLVRHRPPRRLPY